MSAPRAKRHRPVDSIHLRMGNLLVALVLILPISAVNQMPDPLTSLFPRVGKNSGWIPLLLGMLAYPLIMLLLRRRPPERLRFLSICAGVALSFIPFFFYWLAHVIWHIELPLVSIAIRSAVAAAILTTLGGWYVPRAFSRRDADWADPAK